MSTFTNTLLKKLLMLAVPVLLTMSGLHAYAQSDMLAVIETDLGDITLEFFPDDAPRHVENFVDLAETGFYDGTVFHRIISGFMIQGGDPNTISGDPATWGTGGPADSVDAEFNTIKHKRGILSMARSLDPNSAGSQFFIVHQDSFFLDGDYTVFGRVVTEGSLDTLDMIANVPTGSRDVPLDPEQVRITKISIIPRSDALGLLELPDPERTTSVLTPSADPTMGSQRFESQEHRFAFSAPAGWLLQEPSGTDLGTPNVVAVGPKNGILDPFISITVEDTNQRTADEVFTQISAAIDELEAAELLDVASREEITIGDHRAHVVVADTISDDVIETRFHQVLVYGSDKTYTITYANGLDDFNSQLPAFQAALDSFEILSESPIPDEDRPGHDGGDASSVYASPEEGGGGCLIATAAIGSEFSPQVQQLRELRDNTVLATTSGSAFMAVFNQVYYSFSPAIADLERQNPAFKEIVRLAITPLLSTLSLLNHAGIDSEAEMLGYGIGVILLNVGVYAAVPAAALYALKMVVCTKSRALQQAQTNARP